jgi:hypothetical protein
MEIKYGFKGHPGSIEDLQAAVGKGWSKIVQKLVEDLESLGWDGRVLQVKEKFGGLRFYVATTSDAIHGRIAEAEHESYRTCEECGNPGCLRAGGWLRTLCEDHSSGRPEMTL